MDKIVQEAMRPKLLKIGSVVSDESKETDEDMRYNYEMGWANSKKFIKQLAKDNIDPALLNEELVRYAENWRRHSFRWSCLSYLRSSVFQIILCIFVLIDSAIVITEIILEIRSIQNYKRLFSLKSQILASLMARHAKQGCPSSDRSWEVSDIHLPSQSISNQDMIHDNTPMHANSNTAIHDEHTLETLNDFILCWKNVFHIETVERMNRTHNSCDTILPKTCSFINGTMLNFSHLTQDMLNPATLHFASEAMHFISIGVTSLFIICILLKLVCLGRKFFTNVYEVIDALVILISYISDIAYIRLDSQEISAMVVLLLWRIARLINAMLMYERQRCEFRVALQKRTRRLQERKVDILQREKELFQKHTFALEEFLRVLGASEDAIRDCKPRYVHHTKDQTQNALKSIAALTTGFMGGLVKAPITSPEVLARFTATSGLGSPSQVPATQITQSSCASGFGDNYSSSVNCDSYTSLMGNSTSKLGLQQSTINHEDTIVGDQTFASRKEYLLRTRAETLMRNVVLHQISNAMEESHLHMSKLSEYEKTNNNSKSLLKGLIGGHYRKKSTSSASKKNIPFGRIRRQTINPINSEFRKQRRMTSFDVDDEAGSTSSELYNPILAQTRQPDKHVLAENFNMDDSPTTDYDDFEADLLLSTEACVEATTSTLLSPPVPLLILKDDGCSINSVSTSTPTPIPSQPPSLMVNSYEFFFKGSSVVIGESKSSESIKEKTFLHANGSHNHQHDKSGAGGGLGRRNSDCPKLPMLLLPERRSMCEKINCSIQSTIIRTSSERRFDISPVKSPNSLEVMGNRTNRAMSSSLAIV